MTYTIEATIAPKTGFAAHQNMVPLLRELRLTSGAKDIANDLTLTLTADPPFLSSRTWRIDRMTADSRLNISDRNITLNATFLGDLTEALSGEVRLHLTCNDETLADLRQPVELLARSEWGGAAMPELLPVFVMPNDPAVDRVIKAASDALRRAGSPDGIDGYRTKSKKRVWELASAIWTAICGFRLSYALPPASFEQHGQRIRPPSTILDSQVGTCLDTAVLFAAALEQAGLNPLIVLLKGHAFAGVWLQPVEFPSLLMDEAAALRRCIDVQDLLIFETTLATDASPPAFSAAVKSAERQIAEDVETNFIMAVDIRRARMQKIRPLSQIPQEAIHDTSAPPVSEALEAAPNLPDFDIEITAAISSPADRLQHWQRKLLNLTASNRLLNLPDRSKAIRLICPNPASLEDRLARGDKIRIVALPDLAVAGRDEALYQDQTHENLREVYANEALLKGEVLAQLPREKLDSELVELYRATKTDIEEGGSNTLFLALGFLKWKRKPEDIKSYRAPLVLLPMQLERKSANSGVVMRQHEDEPRFNMTLLEMLREDFELTIPELEGELPKDDNGIDIAAVWRTLRRAVRDIPGLEVTEDTVLGSFTFSKYLMWKDLVDRADLLRQSPVVAHLLERNASGLANQTEMVRPEQLDTMIDPAALFTPLPADSSQLAAVVASAQGQNFVLDGPPGTGKSQTIANMIAHNLALGRRVLFVAEKMAALNVVHRRLSEKGLGEFCLELHSNKANKADVLKQLDRAWTTRDHLSTEAWAQEAADAKRLRDNLNDIVALLHRQHPNGLTLHWAIGRVVHAAKPDDPRLMFAPNIIHTAHDITLLRDIARRLGLARREVADLPGAFAHIQQTDWSNRWQEQLATLAHTILPLLDAAEQAGAALCQTSRLILPTHLLHPLISQILACHGHDLRAAFAPDFPEKQKALIQAQDILRRYHAAMAQLALPCTAEAIRRLDLAALQQAWQTASGKFLFLAGIAQKKIAKDIACQLGLIQPVDFSKAAPHLAVLQTCLTELDQLTPRLAELPGWSGPASNATQLNQWLACCTDLRAAITAAASDSEHLTSLRRIVADWVIDANELLSSGGSLYQKLQQSIAADIALQTAVRDFSALVANHADPGLMPVRDLANLVIQYQPRLKAWTDWCRVRAEAEVNGLTPLLSAIADMPETGPALAARVLDMFETIYARWFASQTIDAEPRLRAFTSSVHMDDIAAFRALDDKLAQLAVRRIRAGICSQIPDKESKSSTGGYGVLRHQLQLQRRHKPIRQLASEMGEAFTRLAPCMMMSPLSIAQYLPPDQALFDLIIFDEASQIAPWDAIGAMARSAQVIIAGDPRQMPPTNFFGRSPGDSEDSEQDMESILDECLAAGIPQTSLTWHYRSRHESLIAFSNHKYYDNILVTFPAATTRPSAVEWHRVDGIYARGSGRTNTREAQTIVDAAIRLLTDPAFIAAQKSLGIITLNADQQRLIEDLLDQARRNTPAIEPHFSPDRSEPVVVKNLETVQGDERDIIFLGIGFGPTEAGAPTMAMNFGPLNSQGGWRRLNVALTRARQEMHIFTSFDPNMIDLNRTNARAVRDLKHFIEFADRGPRALSEALQGSVGGHDSPFEAAVSQELTRRGWCVVPQIGVSRFRIDLGIVHPDRPGDYLLGVECDGATYHSAATARDRDKVRAAILGSLGWTLLRIWSTDWWIDKHRAAEKLHQAISEVLENQRRQKTEELAQAAAQASIAPTPEIVVPPQVRQFAEAQSPFRGAPAAEHYRLADFTTHAESIDAKAFHDAAYDVVLRGLIQHVISLEAPISETQLVQRIARAHGFQRSGRLIHERVMGIVAQHHHVALEEEATNFVWPDKDAPNLWQHYRTPASDDDVRSIEDVPGPELLAALRASEAEDKAVEVARMFGIKRLSNTTRQRIEGFMQKI